MKWTALWLGLNVAFVVHGLTEPVLSPMFLLNAFAAGLLAATLAFEWAEAA